MGESQASAYRQAVSRKGTDKTIWEAASRLAVKVAARVQELLQQVHGQVVEGLVYRYEEAMAELTAIQRAAFMKGEYSAATGAVAKKLKISGLEVDPRQNMRTPFQDASDEELDAQIAKAQSDLKKATAH